ncbi:MAG: GMC family oxidoreductase [Halioglobus sp.]
MLEYPSTVDNLLGNTALADFDVVVIGSGAGGSAATRVLATNGLKVCVLEAGNNYFPGLDDPAGLPPPLFSSDELKLSARGLIRQQSTIEPRSFRPSELDGDRTYIGDVNALPKTVGGGWVHADMKTPRFQAMDFRLGSALAGQFNDANFADWPLDYHELEPFYATMERLIGVCGEAGADPFATPRSGPYPLPAGPAMYSATVLSEGARRLGLTPFPYPSAQLSRPYRGRPPCNDCGFCSGYGCPVHAKGSPPVTLMRDALLTGNVQLRFNTIATRLVTGGNGRVVTAVEYLDPAGRPGSVSGDLVMLAASPIESARLCLLSDPSGTGLGNSSGAVGRHLMFHHQTISLGVYPQRFHGERGKSVSTGMADWRGVPNDPDRPLGGIVEFGVNSERISDMLTYTSLGLRGTRLKEFMRGTPFGGRAAVLIMQGEDAPQWSNRVDLDPVLRDVNGIPVPRITYKPHAFELMARDVYGPKMIALHGAAGAQFAFVAPIFEGDPTPGSAHIMGTLRMGVNPATSVTDAQCRFHDIENLYSVDGAPFPTSSGYNPTLTIQALAARTAAAIIDPTHPASVIEK